MKIKNLQFKHKVVNPEPPTLVLPNVPARERPQTVVSSAREAPSVPLTRDHPDSSRDPAYSSASETSLTVKNVNNTQLRLFQVLKHLSQ